MSQGMPSVGARRAEDSHRRAEDSCRREDVTMTRREVREEIFKMIFQVEFYQEEELPEQFAVFLGEETDLGENRAYISDKAGDILAHLGEIDDSINEKVEGWKTSRMAKVDLTLIRMAVYEIVYEKLPVGVAINEAVDISKKYGTDRSPAFVNGVLAKFS